MNVHGQCNKSVDVSPDKADLHPPYKRKIHNLVAINSLYIVLHGE